MLKQIASAILLVTFTVPAFASGTRYYTHIPRKFDKVMWKSSVQTRWSMLDSYLENHKIIGASKMTIESDLGKPEIANNNIAKYVLEEIKGQVYCGNNSFTRLIFDYHHGKVYRYQLWQNPRFVEDNQPSKNKFNGTPIDLNWHYT